MKKRRDEKTLEEMLQTQKAETAFFRQQIRDNSEDINFKENSIEYLIVEILTKLTGNNLTGDKYTDGMLMESFHSYICDLEKLYLIRNRESSN